MVPKKKRAEVEKQRGELNNEVGDSYEINLVTNQQLAEKGEELNEQELKGRKREEIPVVRQGNIEEDEVDDDKKGLIDRLRGKAPAGYLNVLNSFVHTIFDGFALGAGFGDGMTDQFLPVLIAIYAHEVPRQMGDVGVLMKSRFTGPQTIFFNSTPNIGTVIGAVIALAIG